MAGRTVSAPQGHWQAERRLEEARRAAHNLRAPLLSSLSSRPPLAAVVLLGGTAGCAIPPDDVHLAPLYSHHRLAAGGYSHEALGGLFEVRKETRGGRPLGMSGGWGIGTVGGEMT